MSPRISKKLIEERAAQIKKLPNAPGVYIMKNGAGKIIYIGKAKDLKKRVSSYFTPRPNDDRASIPWLRREVRSLETIVTGGEKEALILENELIKEHKPRYNVDLKDDKRYLSLRIDLLHRYPRLEITRRQRPDGAIYFGPYGSATSFRAMVKFINRHFKLRVCSDRAFALRKKPCLWHDMHRCPAPCVLPVSEDEYRHQVKRAIMFLRGELDELMASVEAEMKKMASVEAFERAAYFRDLLADLRKSAGFRMAVMTRGKNYDIIGFARTGEEACVYVLYIRNGIIRNGRPFIFRKQRIFDEDVLAQFLARYYERQGDMPEGAIIPFELEEREALVAWLREKRGKKTFLVHPKRGRLLELLHTANKNAAVSLKSQDAEEKQRANALERIQKLARLSGLPEKIECYDISLFQGGHAVGSRVVFEGGAPKKDLYRRYKIKAVEGTDDFAMLREIIERRLKRLAEDAAPDLMIIDGGKGQLNAAYEALREQGLQEKIPVIALAKSRGIGESGEGEPERSDERIFLHGRKNPIILSRPSPEKFLLMNIRDEAHRFAITFHRELRSKSALKSALLEIEGVGSKRAKLLLKSFGSIKRVREAELEELKATKGLDAKTAEKIYAHFRRVEAADK